MTQLKKLYHNSPHHFEMPSYDKCVVNRQHHDNGALGFWFSTTNAWQAGFGKNCYEFEVTGKPKIIQFSNFHKMCMRVADGIISDYKIIRDDFLSNGYTHILIQEHNERIDMGIVLDFNCIKQFTLLESA